MVNLILLWSDSLLRVKLSNLKVIKLLKKLPQRILGAFFCYNNIIIINFTFIIIIIIKIKELQILF